MLRPGVTACIAAHPARFRNGLLTQALNSVNQQILQPDAIIVVNDKDRHGAGWTRQRILELVDTEWFAWLDSDDRWYPNHLQDLWEEQQRTGAMYVYSWFEARLDPLGHFDKTFDIHNPHHTTITALVNTAIAKEVGYPETDRSSPYSSEDWGFIVDFAKICVDRGLDMVHLPKRTWFWNQAGQNTSGQPDRGDAA